MRQFYKYDKDESKVFEVVTSGDGNSETQIKMLTTEAQALVDSGDAVLYDTHTELREAVQYASDRRNNYPAIEEQLDSLYHEIIVSGSLTSSGSWAQSIRAVKDAHPKPE